MLKVCIMSSLTTCSGQGVVVQGKKSVLLRIFDISSHRIN